MFFKNVHDDGLVKISCNITSKCNYNCPYCYNKSILNKFNDISIKTLIFFLNHFWKETKSNLHIELMGGEPLLYKDLKNILIKLYFIDFVKKISIYTNGASSLKNVIFSEKLNIWFSIHPSEIKDYKKLSENILFCNEKCKTFVILNKFKIKKIPSWFLNTLKNNNVLIIENDIYSNNEYQNLDLSNEKKYLLNNELLSLNDVFVKKISFKNWYCKINSYTLTSDLKLTSDCIGNLGSIFKLSTYKRIKKIFKCPFEYCKTECTLSRPKFNKNI